MRVIFWPLKLDRFFCRLWIWSFNFFPIQLIPLFFQICWQKSLSSLKCSSGVPALSTPRPLPAPFKAKHHHPSWSFWQSWKWKWWHSFHTNGYNLNGWIFMEMKNLIFLMLNNMIMKTIKGSTSHGLTQRQSPRQVQGSRQHRQRQLEATCR